MTTVLKYNIEYKGILGESWTIKIYDTREVPFDPIDITAGQNPCVVTMDGDGDENNIYDPIRQSTAKINLKLEPGTMSILDDLKNIVDNSLCVNIESTAGFAWFGWIIPDQVTRTFSKVNQLLTLTAKDHFSYIKGKRLTHEDGTVVYGKTALMDIMGDAFRQWDTTFTNSPVVVNKATLDNTASELIGKNIFEQVEVEAEMFNDQNAIAGNGYDVMKAILASFACFAYFYNYRLHVINPVDLDTTIFKTLKIMDDTSLQDFIIGNDEQMTFFRGMKEVSVETDYQNNTGFLKNPNFILWDEPPTLPQEWAIDNGGTVIRVGNGRPENPVSVGLLVSGDETRARLRQTSFKTDYKKGDVVKLDVGYKYFDWILSTGDSEYLYIVPVCLILTGKDGNTYFSRSLAYSDQYKGFKPQGEESPVWVLQEPGETALDINPHINEGAGRVINALAVNPNSVDAEQTSTIRMPPLPSGGTIEVTVQAVRVYEYFSDTTTTPVISEFVDVTDLHKNKSYVNFIKAILGFENTDQSVGDKTYLTQVEEFTGRADTIEMAIDTNIPETLAGATFAAIPFGTTTKDQKVDGLMTLDQNTKFPLATWTVKNLMYYQRNTRSKIELSFLSNNIFFTDLLKLEGLSDSVFLQLKNEYNTKKGTQRVALAELKGAYKSWTDSGVPTETQDILEYYPKYD